MVAATCCTGVLHGFGWELCIDRQLSVFSSAQLAWSLWGWLSVGTNGAKGASLDWKTCDKIIYVYRQDWTWSHSTWLTGCKIERE